MERHVINKKRAFICILLLALSLLLIGASRIKQDLQQVENNKNTENDKWLEIVAGMADELPVEHRAQWKKLAAEKPQLFIKASTASIAKAID
jgi:hypothetical protein